jgi:uncharacterized protein (TIGR02266 family)
MVRLHVRAPVPFLAGCRPSSMDLYDDGSTLIRPKRQDERRSAIRLPVEIDVRVEGAAHQFAGVTGDLSPGGMFIATPNFRGRFIPVGTHVVLTFQLRQNGEPHEFAVIGVVQWRRDDHHDGLPGLGVAFFCLDPEVRATLVQFCSVRERLYSFPEHEQEEHQEDDIAQSA